MEIVRSEVAALLVERLDPGHTLGDGLRKVDDHAARVGAF
ncbi:hypothetical protein PAMC26577_15990 [Caballeronia sordidicola]|uniref:Uncharacterized protein n=1 Tax=Caballeronia sordidicola TaxID=196367 RepID=A0A242MSU8_CABSO|nr:hypothetical protein PAMC26577_15990 [Caballeronia sordidicola]